MRTQEHMVVALPTDKPSRLAIIKCDRFGDKWGYLWAQYIKSKTYLPHHLYFLSDEDIKEGDWIIVGKEQHLRQCTYIKDERYLIVGKTVQIFKEVCKKVIATSNPDLWLKYNFTSTQYDRCLPKIDTTFIEAYVREQGKIDKVLLEYEEIAEIPEYDPYGSVSIMGHVFNNLKKDIKIYKLGKRENSEYYVVGEDKEFSMRQICPWKESFPLKLKPNGSVIVFPYKEKTYTYQQIKHLVFDIANKEVVIMNENDLQTWLKTNYSE